MSAPLVVNTRDGMCWTRRTVTSSGIALYAPEGVCGCPEFVMATLVELAEHGICGSADVLPVPVGPELQAPMSLKAALIRLAQYGERTSTWSTATYDSGAEKALHEIAVTLDAALKSGRERYKAGLRRADEQVNAMSEELKRYAAGTETPVLWSVYNAMHLRAVNAETELEQLRTRVAELEAERHVTNEALDDAVQELRTPYAERARRETHPGRRQAWLMLARVEESERVANALLTPEASRSADKLTQLLAPTQALRDDDPNHLRHTYRLGRELPETGGVQ
ncbi:hypothetical protein [Streptomyces sp. NPDC093591]|uniref:hypothetical protein n=1 Tax=Streptomyces sp. NPDC093591 TaxID=3366044 RepID=UPI003803887E